MKYLFKGGEECKDSSKVEDFLEREVQKDPPLGLKNTRGEAPGRGAVGWGCIMEKRGGSQEGEQAENRVSILFPGQAGKWCLSCMEMSHVWKFLMYENLCFVC